MVYVIERSGHAPYKRKKREIMKDRTTNLSIEWPVRSTEGIVVWGTIAGHYVAHDTSDFLKLSAYIFWSGRLNLV